MAGPTAMRREDLAWDVSEPVRARDPLPPRRWKDAETDCDDARDQPEDRCDAHPAPAGETRVHSRAQAVAVAFQLGLVEPDVQAHGLVEPELDQHVFFIAAVPVN